MIDKTKILAIAELTFRKIKELPFMILMLFAVVIGYCVSEMGSISFREDDLLLSGLIAAGNGHTPLAGFLLILIVTMLLAVFSGATEIPRDIESRMVMLMLSKPVERLEYLLGKYIGITAICVLFFFIASVSLTFSHSIISEEAINPVFIVRQYLLLLAIFPLVAIAITVSLFFNDISAIIVTVIYLLFSIAISAATLFVEMLPKSLHVTSGIYFLYYFVPNFFYFFHSSQIIGFIPLAMFVYSASITTVFLMIANFRINSRDLI